MTLSSPPNNEAPEQGLKTEEVIPFVQKNSEEVRAALGIPTKAEIENSDPRVPSLMCDPFLDEKEFLARTAEAQAILIVSFATGAMPNRLAPAIQQRLQQGIPVFVLSDNAGDKHGILRVIYEAGKGTYDAGAKGLQKVNVNQHKDVKAAILEALEKGLRGQELADEIAQRYAYKEGEELPKTEWEDPNYIDPPRKSIRDILRDGGFADENGNYIPDNYRPYKN